MRLRCRSRLATYPTDAADFDRVLDIEKPRCPRDPLSPHLHHRFLDLYSPAATATYQMVVMRVGAAPAVHRFPVERTNDVYSTGIGEHLQMPVDRGESDLLTVAAKLSVQVLGAAEAGRLFEDGVNRFTLPSGTNRTGRHCSTSTGAASRRAAPLSSVA